jgi:hypothetical protein
MWREIINSLHQAVRLSPRDVDEWAARGGWMYVSLYLSAVLFVLSTIRLKIR